MTPFRRAPRCRRRRLEICSKLPPALALDTEASGGVCEERSDEGAHGVLCMRKEEGVDVCSLENGLQKKKKRE